MREVPLYLTPEYPDLFSNLGVRFADRICAGLVALPANTPRGGVTNLFTNPLKEDQLVYKRGPTRIQT